jgi:hypothetical protein
MQARLFFTKVLSCFDLGLVGRQDIKLNRDLTRYGSLGKPEVSIRLMPHSGHSAGKMYEKIPIIAII